MPPDRHFGEVHGFPEGAAFSSRSSLSEAGVHAPPQAGISGSQDEGADSIVVSGGYEDDEDFGDVIIYTGQGGRDPQTGQQIADQELTRGNRALARSADEGLPVRVVRGSGGDPAHSPASGYRYDGLHAVEEYWAEVGRSGHLVYRFRLRKLDEYATVPVDEQDDRPATRIATTVQRIVRTTEIARRVKALHDHRCQMCGTRLETPAGPYAEAAHVRPLGAPHNGPDELSNLLCLCANCHVLFERGARTIADDFIVMGGEAGLRLRVHSEHPIRTDHIAYHRDHVARPPGDA